MQIAKFSKCKRHSIVNETDQTSRTSEWLIRRAGDFRWRDLRRHQEGHRNRKWLPRRGESVSRFGPSSRPFRSAFSLREYIVVFQNYLYEPSFPKSILSSSPISQIKFDHNSLVNLINFRVLQRLYGSHINGCISKVGFDFVCKLA